MHAVRDDGSTSQEIAVTGEYTGEILTHQGATGTVGFQVRADGPWALVSQSLVTVPDSEEPARRYEGTGDAVVGFPITFDDPSPVVAFSEVRVTHEGEANFVVREMFRDLLVEAVGSYDDTVPLPDDGLFGLEITADGSWTVTFQ